MLLRQAFPWSRLESGCLQIVLFPLLLVGLVSASSKGASLHEQIDQEIRRHAGGTLAPVSDDAEFLRRVHLDLAGMPPDAGELRQFLASTDPAKRAREIDRLLVADTFPRRMREWLSAMLLERRTDTKVGDPKWSAYLEHAFAENKPWNQLVAELIFSEPAADKQPHPAERFFLVDGRADLHQRTQDVFRLFLGRDVMCAQCHDHPTVNDFKQSDYFGLYSFLQETADKSKSEFESVFNPGKQTTGPRLPGGMEMVIPVSTQGPSAANPARPRILLAMALTSPDNRLFTQNSVNRFWYFLMGRGLVHPLDMIHTDNPPSHPQLLETLSQTFVASGYDVKQLLREIMLSDAYQRSSLQPADGSLDDPALQVRYRSALPKPLTPEQMAWSVMRVTGNLDRILQAPRPESSSFTYQNYINGRITQLPNHLTDVMTLFIGVFGNPPGEPETTFNPAVGHSLFLMNEPLILDWLKPQPGNLVAHLIRQENDSQLIDELYASILTRLPTDEESQVVTEYLKRFADRRPAAISELAWALLASAEFRLNH
jgi:hypothetical protein